MPQNDGDETGVKAILALWEHCADERNAAVAELIEAARDVVCDSKSWETGINQQLIDRLETALAAIKGGDDE